MTFRAIFKEFPTNLRERWAKMLRLQAKVFELHEKAKNVLKSLIVSSWPQFYDKVLRYFKQFKDLMTTRIQIQRIQRFSQIFHHERCWLLQNKVNFYLKKKLHATSLVYVSPAWVTSDLTEFMADIRSSSENKWAIEEETRNSLTYTIMSWFTKSFSPSNRRSFSRWQEGIWKYQKD